MKKQDTKQDKVQTPYQIAVYTRSVIHGEFMKELRNRDKAERDYIHNRDAERITPLLREIEAANSHVIFAVERLRKAHIEIERTFNAEEYAQSVVNLLTS